MKQTPRNQIEWGRRYAIALHRAKMGDPGRALSAPDAAIVRFRVDYPNLMKRVPVTVKDLPKHVGGRAASHGQPPQFGTADYRQWLKAKPKPFIEVSRTLKDPKRALYTMAHEMRHAVDSMKEGTNLKAATAVRREKSIPYIFRPREWRADVAGVKKVVGAYNLTGAKKAAFTARAMYGRRAKWIAYQRGPRAAAVGAIGYLAAVEYKKYLNKKKAAVEAAA